MTPDGPTLSPSAVLGDALPSEWTIAPMGIDDVDAVLAIEEASFSNPWTRGMLEGELRNAGISFGYVLRTPGRPVAAFSTIWVVVDEIHINNLAVHPHCRRQGMAFVLLSFILRHWASVGASRATLEVRESNGAARELYVRLGFRVAGRRRCYYTNPVEDALVLWTDRLV